MKLLQLISNLSENCITSALTCRPSGFAQPPREPESYCRPPEMSLNVYSNSEITQPGHKGKAPNIEIRLGLTCCIVYCDGSPSSDNFSSFTGKMTPNG